VVGTVNIRFGDCRLDTEARRLFRGAEEVHLSPKAYELLTVLIAERPRALAKAELLQRVWPDVFVSDASLAKVVSEIREGIGDSARQPCILRTVHRYGYAFAGEVDEEEARQSAPGAPSCALICGRREFTLPPGEHIAGRDPDASVWLESLKVSRRHARITVSGTRATIEDLDSKNGTFVGRERIAQPTVLQPGDEVRIGPFTLVFRVFGVAGSTETEALTRG